MELIDTHCHLTFKQFTATLKAVIARADSAGVTQLITVGTDPDDNKKAIALTEKFDQVYAAVGLHPHVARDVTAADLKELKELTRYDKVVAIGETGLDFHYNFSKQPDQKKLFAAQLEIAAELDLPVIIHSRQAFDETMEILESKGRGIEKIVFHCFGGSAEQAKIILEKGYYISFTGVVTFKNAETVHQAAMAVPLDRLMLETDCPYMSPAPMRKQKVNEPALMVHTAVFVAGLKSMQPEDLAAAVTAASRAFFNLPKT